MKRGKKSVVLLLVLLFCLSGMPTYAAESESSINRFNVMVVLDASGSMDWSDGEGLRYDAIRDFINLLAQEGNYLGGVVYASEVEALQSPSLVTNQTGKDTVVGVLESISPYGYTNTGEALYVAAEELKENGNPDLPSVIVFLSDGNTEMPTADETVASEAQKAEAIELAKQEEIQIYSVCLNANNTADTTEMERISNGTGGQFQEVNTPEDLNAVFEAFYAMVYGGIKVSLPIPNPIPESGVISTTFEVPGSGVEEINITIYGNTTDVELTKPDGSKADFYESKSPVSTFIKITDVQAGTWGLTVYGSPGENIAVNLICNTNLGVSVFVDADKDDIRTKTAFTVEANLLDGATIATQDSQYLGYEATLHLMDAYGGEIGTYPMTLDDGRFCKALTLDQGVYYLNVTLEGDYVQRTSENVGPLTVADAPVPPNTAPVAVEDTVEKTVYIVPFKDASFELDLTTLATDAEDSSLVYRIVSSSFLEGTDYALNQDMLSIHNFGLSKGSFNVQATDSGGLSCNVNVVVSSYNVGLMTLIGIGIGALIALIVFGVGLYIALNKPFRGSIMMQSNCNGNYRGISRTPRRGRCKLSLFQTDSVGLELSKCYFQATGKPSVILVLNKKIKHEGKLTKKIEIHSGSGEVQIFPVEGNPNSLNVKFQSNIPLKYQRNGARR